MNYVFRPTILAAVMTFIANALRSIFDFFLSVKICRNLDNFFVLFGFEFKLYLSCFRELYHVSKFLVCTVTTIVCFAIMQVLL